MQSSCQCSTQRNRHLGLAWAALVCSSATSSHVSVPHLYRQSGAAPIIWAAQQLLQLKLVQPGIQCRCILFCLMRDVLLCLAALALHYRQAIAGGTRIVESQWVVPRRQ